MNVHSPNGGDTKMSTSVKNELPTRQREILDAAASLFAEKGYERTPVKEIAEQAEIALGTIYIYFDGKRDILIAIADRVIRQAWSEMQAQMADMDSETYIATVFQNILGFVHENQDFLQALIPEIWTDDELQKQFFNQILAPLLETGASNLEKQIATGQARPCEVEVIVPTVAGSLIMLSLFRNLAPQQFLADFSEDDIIEELNQLYLYGLKPIPKGTE